MEKRSRYTKLAEASKWLGARGTNISRFFHGRFTKLEWCRWMMEHRRMDMAVIQSETFAEYRRAFDEFSQKVRQVQSLTSLDTEPEALFTATLEVEEARMTYNRLRDALTEQVLPAA
jgi:hypothetical protein